jgi:hypothetical protein
MGVTATGEESQAPIYDSYRHFVGGLAQLLPGRERYWRPVNTTVGEQLDPSVPRRWSSDTTYRPRNPNLAPWVRRKLAELPT